MRIRLIDIEEVEGSNPARSTKLHPYMEVYVLLCLHRGTGINVGILAWFHVRRGCAMIDVILDIVGLKKEVGR
jgi:hypothetical protein